MSVAFALVGFGILSEMTILLFSVAAGGLFAQEGTFLGAFFLLLLGAIVVEMYQEWLGARTNLGGGFSATDKQNALAVICGALLTFAISNEVGLGAVIAASLVGLAAAAGFRRWEVATYCGAFVGMASDALFTSYWLVLLAALTAAVIFVATKGMFNGFGGKLGTIALSGCVLATLLNGRIFIPGGIPNWNEGWMIIVCSAVAAVLTFFLNTRLKFGAVASSALVGLVGGVGFSVVPDPYGSGLAVVTICASFAGMSSQERIRTELQMLAAGAIAGVAFMFTAPFFGGTGGKLGTIAFGSVIAVSGLSRGWQASMALQRPREQHRK